MQIAFNTVQGIALVDFLRDNLGAEGFVLTAQGDSVYVATDLASATIDTNGEVDEA